MNIRLLTETGCSPYLTWVNSGDYKLYKWKLKVKVLADLNSDVSRFLFSVLSWTNKTWELFCLIQIIIWKPGSVCFLNSLRRRTVVTQNTEAKSHHQSINQLINHTHTHHTYARTYVHAHIPHTGPISEGWDHWTQRGPTPLDRGAAAAAIGGCTRHALKICISSEAARVHAYVFVQTTCVKSMRRSSAAGMQRTLGALKMAAPANLSIVVAARWGGCQPAFTV